MTTVWEEVWEQFDAHVRRLWERLATEFPGLNWSSGHSDNEAFAFRGFASFRRRQDSETDVVVSVDFLRTESGLSFSSDVALQDGQILADGPTGCIACNDDPTVVRSELRSIVNNVGAFIDDHVDVIKQSLRTAT